MTKKYIAPALRRLVVERARNLCEYCRYPGRYAPQTPPVDHIIPQDAGGPTTAENLAQSCQGCNGHKAARTTAPDPVTGKWFRFFIRASNDGMSTLRGVKIICASLD